jgi:hypothetical protein
MCLNIALVKTAATNANTALHTLVAILIAYKIVFQLWHPYPGVRHNLNLNQLNGFERLCMGSTDAWGQNARLRVFLMAVI